MNLRPLPYATYSFHQWRWGAIVSLAGGALLFWCFGTPLTESLLSLTWPRTTATVREWSVGGAMGIDQFIVHYDYRIDGQSFDSRRIGFAWSYYHFDPALKAFGYLQPGDSLDVAYNPSHPERAVIFTGPRTGLLVVIGLIFVLIGGGVWRLCWRQAGNA